MGLVTWLILGALIGWISGLLTGRSDRIGCLSSIIVAVIGAVIGGLLGSVAFGGGVTSFAMQPTVIAVILSILLLCLGNMLIGPVDTHEVSS